MVKVFFSYSHRDEELRNELETHLAMLKRQGVISTWHDRRIGAGQDIDESISEHLEDSHIILLLVSPYFLASAYCYDVEMRRALERHESKEARVIPVILEPCDWKTAPFGRLRATPQDGMPVSKFPNMHDAFLDVVNDIRSSAAGFDTQTTPEEPLESTEAHPAEIEPRPEARTSNLRVHREFTDKQQDEFLDEAYQYVKGFFENSLAELDKRNPEVETRFVEVDRNHFTATAYIAGTKTTSCRIWLAGRGGFPNGIGYSNDDSGTGNSFNEALSVADDGQSLLLRPMIIAMRGRSGSELLTKHGAAEHLWAIFIQPLQ